MIKLVVKAKTLWPVVMREDAIYAAKFAMHYYNLDAKVTLKLGFKEGYAGQALQLDNDDIIVYISANTSIEEVMFAIFHEFTHVKQYLRGEFAVLENDKIKWNGKEINFDWECETSYNQAEWEIEARRMELVLMQKFLDIPC